MALNKETSSFAGRPSAVWSCVALLGMAVVFAGERAIAVGKARAVATLLGLLLVLVSLGVRALRVGRAREGRKVVERRLLLFGVIGLLAVVLYFLQSDAVTLLGQRILATTSPKLATVLAALWPAVWLLAALATAAIELSYATMRLAPVLELHRIRAAQNAGVGLSFVLVFCMSLAYVASERDPKVDLAYFRTTRPGESTRKIVRALDQPLTIAIFFPKANDVREEVADYFRDLGGESAELKIENYDFDLDPIKAKELGVSANGTVVVARGQRHELLGLQLQLENARSSLRTLDREVQQRLLSVVRPNRVTLFTQGHGERSLDPAGPNDKRPGMKLLRDALLDQGQDVRELGVATGLATDVPRDASVVMVLGPTKAFLPEEIASLQRFLNRGGRLYLALDPENGVDFHELLAPLGVKTGGVILANDQMYARRTHQDADRVNLVTTTFSSHASITTVSRAGGRMPALFPSAQAVVGLQPRPQGVEIDFPVRAHFATFADKNGNFQADPGEERRAFELAAAIVKKGTKPEEEQRLFVVGDSDFLSDLAVGAYGNAMLVIDPIHWLLGEESFAGQITSEEDVRIVHTRKQDAVWFYSTTVLVPAALVGFGLLVTRRRRGKRPSDSRSFPSSPSPSDTSLEKGISS